MAIAMDNDTGYTPPTVELSVAEQTICKNIIRFGQELGPLIDSVECTGVDCSGYRQLREELLKRAHAIYEKFCEKPKLTQ